LPRRLGHAQPRRRARSFYSIRSGWNIALNRRFEFKKRGELFICSHNETLSVIAVCVSNPDRSPFAIDC
jgi:hypothetical protein